MFHRGVCCLRPDPRDHIATVLPGDEALGNRDLASLINDMGQASSREQGLNHVITTFGVFIASDTKLYILISDDHRSALGFLKVGRRHLFLWDHFGEQHEVQPLCLLDFFVYPSSQRRGFGRKLINRMLVEEGLEMRQIPIDRPSRLCLSFMKKHFGLERYISQANNFVVFQQFWNGDLPSEFPKRTPLKQSLTPVKRQVLRDTYVSQPVAICSRSPRPKRTDINPITWLPYD